MNALLNSLTHPRSRPIAAGQLRAFEAVARHLSFRAASEELALTQSAISRQIQALEEDVGVALFLRHTRAVELTSAGAQLLRAALDKVGIRNRVVAVSACYSGGWVAPLASDNTLVMTAADATHTSYGCGSLSDLTYFGRAMFDEQLRKTRSFEQAFANAVPIIQQREIDAGKDDGFSNPQISAGSGIRGVLKALEQRLEALPPASSVPAQSPVTK